MIETTPTTISAPPISVPLPAPTKWEREYEAFRKLLPELLKTQAGQYVAIHEGTVVDSGPDEMEVAMRVLKNIGNVSFHLGLVTEEPLPISRSGVRRDIRSAGAPA